MRNLRQSHPFLERLRDAPLCLAHRGASAFWPENTLEAAEAGFKAGAQAWEFDVQFTRDGHAVVIHDESLERTTDVSIKFKNDFRAKSGFMVRDFDLSEIQSLDAGHWFIETGNKYRNAAYYGNRDNLSRDLIATLSIGAGRITVPTLSQALALTIELGWFANVELKDFKGFTDSDRLLKTVYETITRMRCERRLLVSSFNHDLLRRLRKRDDQLTLGLLTDVPLAELELIICNQVGADTYHCSSAMLGVGTDEPKRAEKIQDVGLLAQRDILERLRFLAIPTLVYTVNQAADAQKLLQIGPVSIFSDDVQAILEIMNHP